MSVQGLSAVHPDEQMLAAGQNLGYFPAGEVGGGERWHPQLSDGEDATFEGPVESAGVEQDGISFGHTTTLPS
jgi:hypothetical protein